MAEPVITHKSLNPKLTGGFHLIITIVPALGVIFYGWNAIVMLALFIWETSVVSFYAVRMRSRILEYHLDQDAKDTDWDENLPQGFAEMVPQKSNKDYFPFPSLVFFPFFIIYCLTMGLCSFVHILDFPAGEHSALYIFLSPFIRHPETILYLGAAMVGNQLIYSDFLRKDAFKRTSDLHPETAFYYRLIILVSILVLYWPLLLVISAIDIVTVVNSHVFANDVVAIAMVAIKSIPEKTLLRIINFLGDRFGNNKQ